MKKLRILFIIALPPPHHGAVIANDILINSDVVKSKYQIEIVRIKRNMLHSGGRFSITTLLEDSWVILKTIKSLLIDQPVLTYFIISQTRLGMWRDIFVVSLSKLLGSKCVGQLRGSYFRNMYEEKITSPERKIVRKVLKLIDGAIVLDSSLRWIFAGLVPSEKIFLLSNGLPEVFREKEIREAFGRRENSTGLRVTYLSNIIPGKGFDTFLEAAAILSQNDNHRNFLFNLAGTAPTPETAQKLGNFVRRHHLESSVVIHGKVLDRAKWDLLLNSDIFVFPPHQPEGQPWVIIEALAAGLPIIASPQGCIPSMVKEGVNGFLVPAKDPGEIARRLITLREDPALRLSMGKASRILYLNNYTAKKFTQGFCDIVDQVLAQN